jgi:hypothetical protein
LFHLKDHAQALGQQPLLRQYRLAKLLLPLKKLKLLMPLLRMILRIYIQAAIYFFDFCEALSQRP